ncbi:anaerobic C4-dicarboxylate transporter family protein, partial [Klebsiella variicola]|uniref:anaerobic C4-dicarboxylate transporter family protein n=1 Tax=Klebsiella variicola TaxID=244366 RepID=UPI00286FF3C5
MFGAELVIVLLAIYLGARLGGIGIGFAGGLGVLVLTLIFQIKPGAIPFDVIEIIMAVIAAIAAMQVAGGMDYLVSLAERMLRRHPKYITFLAPLVTWRAHGCTPVTIRKPACRLPPGQKKNVKPAIGRDQLR